MKKILLIVLVGFSFALKAQVTRIDTLKQPLINLKGTKFKSEQLHTYTIGLKAYSIEEFPKILNSVEKDNYTYPLLNGLFLKINDNQLSYRLGVNLYSKNITFNNECADCEEANGKLLDMSVKLGFEKNFIYGPVQPYFAFDIGYRRNAFDGNVKNATALDYTEPYDVKTLKNGFLMSPNFGVKLNLTHYLALGVESGIGLLYSYEKQERTYRDVNRTRTFNDYNKWEFLLKPVSMLSLQYNFGESY